MVVGGRWVGTAAALLMTAGALAGCGDVNEGDAFADEFNAYLDTQDAVVAHRSYGQQPLPYVGSAESVVTLDPTLDEPAVVEAATAIVSHRMTTDISEHDLTILFSADGADPASPVVSFYVDATMPLPDDPTTRARLTRLVTTAKSWVPADAGITTVTVEARVVTVETRSEPWRAAPALADVLSQADWAARSLEVVSPAGDRVTVDDDGDLTWLAGVDQLVEQARAAAPSVTYHATASGQVDRGGAATPRPPDPPRLTLAPPEGTADETVAALEALVAPSGVEVSVFAPRRRSSPVPTGSPTP